jgi:hypothetical protein
MRELPTQLIFMQSCKKKKTGSRLRYEVDLVSQRQTFPLDSYCYYVMQPHRAIGGTTRQYLLYCSAVLHSSLSHTALYAMTLFVTKHLPCVTALFIVSANTGSIHDREVFGTILTWVLVKNVVSHIKQVQDSVQRWDLALTLYSRKFI